ncbi:MAG TPA: ferrochelatase [Acidimicrobiales bacterium]|nr:ferrochelatase [Acidimicrobiales bacterium]
MKPVGVLIMAHGTPHSLDELADFYTEIRHGSPPPPELLADLERRYRAIGGTSPLNERTAAQVEGIRDALERRAPERFRVAVGAKFAPPRIADAVGALGRAGVGRLIGLVLAPHFSVASVGDYARRARAAAEALRAGDGGPLDVEMVDHWHLAPGLVALLAARVRHAIDLLPPASRRDVAVVFTAHSIPARLVDEGDPYAAQVLESASAIADWAQLTRWSVAWQSAGRTADAWLEPDVRQVIAALPATGASAVVVCPVGFVSDHLEVLYDVDIEARGAAHDAGIDFARTASLNDDPEFCAVLADVVLAAVEATHA